ncbi:MAG: hypothetical protein KGL12_14095 [Rhodospirillales bacterium]|nr:hypothetical protein [Rhodospirillales bacterium]
MNQALHHSEEALERSREALRRRLLPEREEQDAQAAPPEGWAGHAQPLLDALAAQWRASPWQAALDSIRPVLARAMRRNPLLALSIAAAIGGALGVSPLLRGGLTRALSVVVWKTVDAAALIGLLLQIAARYGEDMPAEAPAAPAPADPVLASPP